MKELSVEQKAKAYDEALKVLHKYDGANIMFSQDLKEEMFPELKESEDENADEKVRKALIKLVTNHASMDLFIEYDIHSYEALDWLEKQGEQKPAWSEEDEQMIGRIRDIVEKYAFSQSAVDVNGDLCEKEYIEADNWLKSLISQNH